MSNITLEKKWQIWSPEALDIKDNKEKKYITDNLLLKKNKEKLGDHKDNSIDQHNKKYYDDGFKEGYKIGYQTGIEQESLKLQKDKLLHDRMYKFLNDFESGLDLIDTIIVPNLIQLALAISKKITGEIPVINQMVLLKKIKEIIKIHPIFSNKPKLRVNPNDQVLIEKNFGSVLNFYGWHIIYDNNISQGGCILDSNNMNIDATVSMFWKQLNQSVLLDENAS